MKVTCEKGISLPTHEKALWSENSRGFQQAVIGGKDKFGLGHLAQLAVEAIDGVGGVNQPPHLLRVLEIGAQV